MPRAPQRVNCSLTIIGDEDEVVRAAAEHAASVHDHEGNDEGRQLIRAHLEPAEDYVAGLHE